jgi:hypothetical protein
MYVKNDIVTISSLRLWKQSRLEFLRDSGREPSQKYSEKLIFLPIIVIIITTTIIIIIMRFKDYIFWPLLSLRERIHPNLTWPNPINS